LVVLVSLAIATALSCGRADDANTCDGSRSLSRAEVRCEAEFLAQAARPADTAIPSARSIKTIVDRARGDAVHFIDTRAFPVHSRFAVEVLGYPASAPFVNEYFLPQRRFLLGSITHFEAPDLWVYELAPYDTASVEQITLGFRRLAESAYFGDRLRFHPASEEQRARAQGLPSDVPVIATTEILAAMTDTPIALGETYGRVRLTSFAELEVKPAQLREIVVLDRATSPIHGAAGFVLATAPAAPLGSVALSAQARRVPALVAEGAAQRLAPYAAQWVHLEVGAFAWRITAVTEAEALAWWRAQAPRSVTVPAPDDGAASITPITKIDHTDVGKMGGTATELAAAAARGAPVRVAPAVVVPISAYARFLTQNGFDAQIAALVADPDFAADPALRRTRLERLVAEMQAASVEPAIVAELAAELGAVAPTVATWDFVPSTNADGVRELSAAGLYAGTRAAAGDPAALAQALRRVWASTWTFTAFEARRRAGVDPARIGMAVLVRARAPGISASGTALTANAYDPAPGGEDAFVIDAQVGDGGIEDAEAAEQAEHLVDYHFHNGQPATIYVRSSRVGGGATVLTRTQRFELGQALTSIRDAASARISPPAGYGRLPLVVEWQLTGDGIFLTSVRVAAGRGEPAWSEKP
jgi:hypothetical protein